MQYRLRTLMIVLALGPPLLAVTGCVDHPPRVWLPEPVQSALENAESFDLYSLEPGDGPDEPSSGFHGWKILGKAEIKEPKHRKKLVEVFQSSIYRFPAGQEERGCFVPRHAIRVTHDDSKIDFIICFQCATAEVWPDGQDVAYALLWTERSHQEIFDSELTRAGVQLAKKPKPL